MHSYAKARTKCNMYVDEIRIFKLNYDKIIPALQKHLYNVFDIQQSTLGLARC